MHVSIVKRMLAPLRRPGVWQSLTGVAALILLVVMLQTIPDLLVGREEALTAEQRVKATNDARASVAQVVGAVGLFATLLLTGRTFLLSRTGQITARYETGIKQLGDDNITVRMGGIYALEQLIRESRSVQQSISEVLASFVRETRYRSGPLPSAHQESPTVASDVQAALAVLGRRDPSRVTRPLDLHDSVLTGADLQRTRLPCARLAGADLDGVQFADASLDGAALQRVRLRKANLSNASLRDADLTGADLRNAVLYQTDFADATLTGCLLAGCDLSTTRNLTPEQRKDAVF